MMDCCTFIKPDSKCSQKLYQLSTIQPISLRKQSAQLNRNPNHQGGNEKLAPKKHLGGAWGLFGADWLNLGQDVMRNPAEKRVLAKQTPLLLSFMASTNILPRFLLGFFLLWFLPLAARLGASRNCRTMIAWRSRGQNKRKTSFKAAAPGIFWEFPLWKCANCVNLYVCFGFRVLSYAPPPALSSRARSFMISPLCLNSHLYLTCRDQSRKPPVFLWAFCVYRPFLVWWLHVTICVVQIISYSNISSFHTDVHEGEVKIDKRDAHTHSARSWSILKGLHSFTSLATPWQDMW